MIGTIVFWELTGGVKREELHKILKAKNQEHWLPNPVSDRKAFMRALKRLEKDKILVKVKDDPEELVYAIATANVDEHNKDVDFSLDDVITLEKATGNVYLKLQNADPNEIQEAIKYFEDTLTADDIRAMIMRALADCKAILLRKRGGVYLVPPDKRDLLMVLKDVVSEIGSELYTLDLVQNTNTMKDTKKLVYDEIFEEIERELKAIEIMAFKKVRSDTIVKAIKRYKNLMTKAKAYEHILKDKLAEVEEKITRLEQRAKNILLSNL